LPPCFSNDFHHKSYPGDGICPQWALPVLPVFSKEASVAKKLYVGNLSYNTSDSDLQRLFEAFGTVQSAQVISDRETGRSKGFGFVEMGSDQEAQAAINGLNGKEVDGRSLTVNEAKPREDRGGGRGGYGGGRSGGGKRW
jgi:RNA recognition motif-containing protein